MEFSVSKQLFMVCVVMLDHSWSAKGSKLVWKFSRSKKIYTFLLTSVCFFFLSSLFQPFSDHGVQATPHQPFAQNAVAMPAPVSQTKQVKVSMVVFGRGSGRGERISLLLID